MGCTAGFRTILDQRLVFTTLDENWIAHALYLSMRSCDAMYRVRESKSKLELIYRFFIELFCNIFLALGLNTCLKGVWNYCYAYRSDLTPFKCWCDFRFFLGLLASFLHARLILTSDARLVKQLKCFLSNTDMTQNFGLWEPTFIRGWESLVRIEMRQTIRCLW